MYFVRRARIRRERKKRLNLHVVVVVVMDITKAALCARAQMFCHTVASSPPCKIYNTFASSGGDNSPENYGQFVLPFHPELLGTSER